MEVGNVPWRKANSRGCIAGKLRNGPGNDVRRDEIANNFRPNLAFATATSGPQGFRAPVRTSQVHSCFISRQIPFPSDWLVENHGSVKLLESLLAEYFLLGNYIRLHIQLASKIGCSNLRQPY